MKKICLGLALVLSGIFMTANAQVQCSYDTFEGYKACRALFDEMMNLPVPQSDNIRELNRVFFKELETLYAQKKSLVASLQKLYSKADANPEDIKKLENELQQLDSKIHKTIGIHSEKSVNLLLPMQKIKYKEVKEEFERITNPNKWFL